jgi:hypothetical protein
MLPRRTNCWLALLGAALALAGCETPPGPFVPKAAVAPEVTYCNDNTGHKAGAKPWVLGGKCCCTPSDELMTQLHKDGFCQGQSAEDLRDAYRKAGIALRGPDHNWCNGLCSSGPHVVMGGKCMCPPTPGTQYAEDVALGRGTAQAPLAMPPNK